MFTMSVFWKYRHIFWPFLIFNFWAVSGNAALNTDPAITFKVEDKSWILNVQRGLLDDLVDHIYQDFQVEILGLETRKRETITLSLKGKSLADIARGLLQYLDEKNFAFEFENDRLKRVLVLPEANVDIRKLSSAISAQGDDQGQSINAVEIQGVIGGRMVQDQAAIVRFEVPGAPREGFRCAERSKSDIYGAAIGAEAVV